MGNASLDARRRDSEFKELKESRDNLSLNSLNSLFSLRYCEVS